MSKVDKDDDGQETKTEITSQTELILMDVLRKCFVEQMGFFVGSAYSLPFCQNEEEKKNKRKKNKSMPFGYGQIE